MYNCPDVVLDGYQLFNGCENKKGAAVFPSPLKTKKGL